MIKFFIVLNSAVCGFVIAGFVYGNVIHPVYGVISLALASIVVGANLARVREK